jgi:general secretion pathway protein G
MTIKVVGLALEAYKRDVGSYPTDEQGLAALWSQPEGIERWKGPYMAELDVDPWGVRYQYRRPGKRHTDSYDLESFGPDGADEGGDDVEN